MAKRCQWRKDAIDSYRLKVMSYDIW